MTPYSLEQTLHNAKIISEAGDTRQAIFQMLLVLLQHLADVEALALSSTNRRTTVSEDGSLCSDCPPIGDEYDGTRCTPCPRRRLAVAPPPAERERPL